MAPPLVLRPPDRVRPLSVSVAGAKTVKRRIRLFPVMTVPALPASSVTSFAITKVFERTMIGQSGSGTMPPCSTAATKSSNPAQLLVRMTVRLKNSVLLNCVVLCSVTVTPIE